MGTTCGSACEHGKKKRVVKNKGRKGEFHLTKGKRDQMVRKNLPFPHFMR